MTDFSTEDGAEQTRPQFTVSRLRRGYSAAEVDEFLDSIAAAVRQGQPVPNVLEARFNVCFGGYDQQEVDIFLDDLHGELSSV